MSTPNPQHPKALEAERRKTELAVMREEVKAARKIGIRFMSNGKLTVAYRIDRRDVVAVGTALLNPHDRYNKTMGEAYALKSFLKGGIQLRLPPCAGVEFLAILFFIGGNGPMHA